MPVYVAMLMGEYESEDHFLKSVPVPGKKNTFQVVKVPKANNIEADTYTQAFTICRERWFDTFDKEHYFSEPESFLELRHEGYSLRRVQQEYLCNDPMCCGEPQYVWAIYDLSEKKVVEYDPFGTSDTWAHGDGETAWHDSDEAVAAFEELLK